MNCSPSFQWHSVANTTLGLVFVSAGLLKFRNWRNFDAMFDRLQLPRPPVRGAVGFGLSAIEVCVGLFLLHGIALRVATTFAELFLVVATIALVRLRALGFDGGCGCFGETGATHIGVSSIVRNTLFFLVGGYALGGAGDGCVAVPIERQMPGHTGLAIAILVGVFGMTTAIQRLEAHARSFPSPGV